MRLNLSDIRYIINESYRRLMLTEISNNAIETLFKKYCGEQIVNNLDKPLSILWDARGVEVSAAERNLNPNMKLKDFMRLKLMQVFEINRGKGPIKYFRGIIRICCDELKYFETQSYHGYMSTFKKIISYIYKNNVDLNEDLNGLGYWDLYKGVGKDMRVHELMSWKKPAKEESTFGEYTVVSIDSYEEASKYSQYTSWCVTQDISHFNTYTRDGSQFYFCLKNGFENVSETEGEGCPIDEYGLSMVSVLIFPDNTIKHVTTRWNHDNRGEDNPNLHTLEQVENVLGIPQNIFVNRNKPLIDLNDLETYIERGGDISNAVEILDEGENGAILFKFQKKYNVVMDNKILYEWHRRYRYNEETKTVVFSDGRDMGWNAFDVNGIFFPKNIVSTPDGEELVYECCAPELDALAFRNSRYHMYFYRRGETKPSLPFGVEQVYEFNQGLALIKDNTNRYNFIDKNCKLLWGYNKLLDVYVPPQQRNKYCNNGVLMLQEGRFYQYYDIFKQRPISNDRYAYMFPFGENTGLVRKENNEWNFVKRDGTYLYKEDFHMIRDDGNGYIIATTNRRQLILDKEGNSVMDKSWPWVEMFNGTYGIVELDGEIKVDDDGNMITSDTEAVIDKDGNIMFSVSGVYLKEIINNKIVGVVTPKNYLYFVDINGKLLTSKHLLQQGRERNDGATPFQDDNTGKWYFVNLTTGDVSYE